MLVGQVGRHGQAQPRQGQADGGWPSVPGRAHAFYCDAELAPEMPDAGARGAAFDAAQVAAGFWPVMVQIFWIRTAAEASISDPMEVLLLPTELRIWLNDFPSSVVSGNCDVCSSHFPPM